MAEKKKIVAIDVGTQRIVGAVFSTSGNRLALLDLTVSDLLADPSAEAARIAQMGPAFREVADRLSVGGSPVIYSIPGHSVFIKFVKLPSLGDDQINDIVRFEAEQNVPFPLNEVIWDYKLMENKAGGQEVMLAAIRAESLNDTQDILEEAEVEVRQVELSPAALYNAYRYNYDDVEVPALLVDIGAKGTNLIYIEGDRWFTRTILTGGTTITQAIAKEMVMPFATAEQQKIERGFVSLGGAYEAPGDPTDAALSRTIRNTLTRVHAEITRTNTLYRQQGGSMPAVVFLCGGTSRLGYIAEFFQEKLGVPVEMFDPLRKVAIDKKLDEDQVATCRPLLGEVVGDALRIKGSCPLELDLVPDSIEKKRDISGRIPYFSMAAVCLLGLLGAAGLFFHKRAQVAGEQREVVSTKVAQLEGVKTQIDKGMGALKGDKEEAGVIGSYFQNRDRWAEMLMAMNNAMQGEKPLDTLWLTLVEPVSGKDQILSSVGGQKFAQGDGSPVYELAKVDDKKDVKSFGAERKADRILIRGLYRGSIDDVYQYASRIAALPMFDAPDYEKKRNDYVTQAVGNDGTTHASNFEIRLPLKNPITF